ncbi:Translocase of outer mitochondrial membrane complex, subunit TOM40 [Phaffia rhodozyma]|uniref:Translocase of outer mitochondrial membrane complex, subunit TOM40 n=1 Tax=Phaffia rhodozyma TaxID=264483 RepID=A0A0F7SJ14_PHARH|nr:Translocase of outer mitochondrial membrane complex, subunit TOM40 [Phaffia rhodozyma]
MSVPLQPTTPAAEKIVVPQVSYLSGVTALLSGFADPVFGQYGKLHNLRNDLFGTVSNPGNVESLGKDVKMTHLTNFTFDGVKADLSKSVSMDPAFQVQHSFSLAKAAEPPSYNFGAVFAKKDLFLQGSIDHEFNSSARINKPWNDWSVTKMQAQLSPIPGHSMVQLEQEFSLPGETLTLKAINPSLTDGTGIYITSLLGAVTPRLSLGFETILQKPTPEISQSVTSLLAKWTSVLTPGNPIPTPMAPTGTPAFHEWTATVQAQMAGIVSATYHHRLSDKVDVGADLNVVMAGGRREATATVGAKYDFRMATFRAQLDSTGKTSMLLEQRFAPTFSFLVSGEIDHMKAGAAKCGFGVMLETTTLTPEELGMVPQPAM